MRSRRLAFLACFALGCSGELGSGENDDDGARVDAATESGASREDASATTIPTGAVGQASGPRPFEALRVACRVKDVIGSCMEVEACDGDRVAVPGYCPGPANIQCCVRRDGDAGPADGGSDDADVDAGGYCPTDPTARPNDTIVEAPGTGGCPPGMLRVAATPPFCIDRFEASLVIDEAGKSATWTPWYPPPDAKTYRAVSVQGAVPQGYVSGVQARRACLAAKKRLCTNDEWLRACRGPSGTTYPYGNVRVPGACNDARSLHPAVQCFGTNASWIWSELGWPGINQQDATVDRTGANPGCVTAEGAFDMMGNLHEWIWDDPAAYSSPVKAIDFRGGFYADTKANGEGCLYRTTAHDFAHWDYSTGFRCCADAP